MSLASLSSPLCSLASNKLLRHADENERDKVNQHLGYLKSPAVASRHITPGYRNSGFTQICAGAIVAFVNVATRTSFWNLLYCDMHTYAHLSLMARTRLRRSNYCPTCCKSTDRTILPEMSSACTRSLVQQTYSLGEIGGWEYPEKRINADSTQYVIFNP
ncbi:hypothetical protein BDR06DRAFT_190306 [Suillus hirtellus]|nr:hypothetical protein BDR06DRAFT_190306 [Suillus hirtellus]